MVQLAWRQKRPFYFAMTRERAVVEMPVRRYWEETTAVLSARTTPGDILPADRCNATA